MDRQEPNIPNKWTSVDSRGQKGQQTDRQTDKQVHRQACIQTERETDKHAAYRQRDKQLGCHTDRQQTDISITLFYNQNIMYFLLASSYYFIVTIL